MKLSKILTAASLAVVLALSAGSLMAQDDNNNNRQGRRNRDGGQGGQGGPGGGNFDPAQFQQRMMERVREDLGFTNDTDWNAVQPLVQKVMDARREVGVGGFGGFGRGGRGGQGGQGGQGGGGRGGAFGQTSPEQQALQNAIEANAPSAQIKDLLAKYKAAKKEKQAKLTAAQADLRKVLSVKQEAQATLMGLVE